MDFEQELQERFQMAAKGSLNGLKKPKGGKALSKIEKGLVYQLAELLPEKEKELFLEHYWLPVPFPEKQKKSIVRLFGCK